MKGRSDPAFFAMGASVDHENPLFNLESTRVFQNAADGTGENLGGFR
jgi:hypothetical protein